MTVPFKAKVSAMDRVAALSRDPHAPLSAMIEIADRCNEVCVHCYQVQGQKGELATDDWRAILDELAEMGVVFLTISGGEATLRHDFLELVAHARRRKFSVKVYTNGLTMTRELAAKMKELAVQEVQISLYSPISEMHDWVTKVPGSFVKTTNAIRFLAEAGVGVVMKSPVMSINVKDRQAFVALAAELGAHYSMDPVLDPREDGDRGPEQLRVRDEDYLALHADPAFRMPRAAHGPRDLDRSVCGACSGNLHIEANGEMQPCTMLGDSVGHAIRDGVREAWAKNETGRSIRQITWGDLPGCRDCDLAAHCGRCFATARHETGDALVPYETACRYAKLQYQVATGHAPTIEPREGRDGSVGPYREVTQGVFSCIDVRFTDADREIARHGWVHGTPREAPKAQVGPGDLVQIRRPGSNRSRREAIPDVAKD